MERRLLLPADVLGHGAAVDVDAGGQLGAERRREPRDRVEPLAVLAHAAAWDAAQQPDGVRVPRVVEDRVDRALLDQPPGVQHADAVAHPRDHVEVVADEQDARAELLAQRRDEVEHLGLHGRVQAGRRLVEHEQRRVLGQRHRDHHALLHPARELMRIAPHHAPRVGDLHLGEHRLGPLVGELVLAAGQRVHLGHLVTDADRRVQRGTRVLVDHPHLLRAHAPHVALGHLREVGAGHLDRSVGDAAVAR